MTTLVIARNTIGEALRKKILWIFFFVATAFIVLTISMSQFAMVMTPGGKPDLTVTRGLGLGMIELVGLLIIIVLGINLISVEIERRTIYTILSKPVRRHEFLMGKFLGSLATLFINLALMTIVFMAMVTWANQWKPEWGLLKGSLMLFFELALVGSVSMFFSVFTTPVVNFFLTAAVYVIGNMTDYTLSMTSLTRNPNPLSRGFFWLMHWIVPQFANFHVQNPLIHPEVVVSGELTYYVDNIVYAVLYACVLLILAILVFERRDM